MKINYNIISKIKKMKIRNKNFMKFLKFNDVDKKKIKNISVVDDSNILLKNFIHLLKLEELNEDIYLDNITFLRICSRYLFASTAKSDESELLKRLSDIISRIVSENDDYGQFIDNYEEQVLKESELVFSDNEIEKHFSFHKIYTLIGNAFTVPFSKKDRKHYYEFGYFLAMYLNMHYFVNKKSIPENIDMFSMKLIVNKKQILALSNISPEFYNLVVIKNNKRLNHINKKKIVEEIKEYEEKA